MTKKVIKEIIIMLLLCLAIILVLGVLLYEYVPSNKIVTDEVSYTTPEEVQEEISKGENVDDEEVILTYSIDATDLNNYERINTYVPGKPNPFSSYDTATSTGAGETQNNSSSSGSSSGSSSSNSGTSSGTNSTGSSGSTTGESTSGNTTSSGSEYFPDSGTK